MFAIFEDGGLTLRPLNLSSHYDSQPANVYFPQTPGDSYNPAVRATGRCPGPQVSLDGVWCYADYLSPLEIVPEQQGHTLMLSAIQNLAGGHRLEGEVLRTDRQTVSRLAPTPADFDLTGTPFQPSGGGDPVIAYGRLFDLGRRISQERSS